MSFVVLTWPISGGYQILGLPPGFDPDNGYSYAMDASDDGRHIVGFFSVDGSLELPCRWDDGVFTELTGPDVDPYTNAVAVSSDGNVVVGVTDNGSLILWTSPSSGTHLTPLSGDTDTYNDNQGPGMLSDDGLVVVGFSLPSGHNTRWNIGAPADFGDRSISSNTTMTFCSADGSMIAGGISGFGGIPGYWTTRGLPFTSGFHPLFSYDPGGTVYGVSSDGTVIYGSAVDSFGVVRQCYWDNLSSTSPLGAGTVHFLPSSGGGTIEDFASAAYVAVGHNFAEILCACRWDGTTFTNLQPTPIPPSGWFYGRAMGCNSDGTIVSGEAADPSPPFNGNSRACYWDAANVIHYLDIPSPSNPFDITLNSYAQGVSRDGTMFFGDADIDFTPGSAYWQIIGSPKGAVGDVWSDPSYVDFSDAGVRARFINPDGSWLTLGPYGETPTGTSPISFLTSQASLDPYSIEWNYGQYNGAYSWVDDIVGTDPTTGLAYTNLMFDTLCAVIVIGTLDIDQEDETFTGVAFTGEITRLILDDVRVVGSDGSPDLVYRWRSRQFYLGAPASMGACQISLNKQVSNFLPYPANIPPLNPGDPVIIMPAGVNAMFNLYVGPKGRTLYMSKVLDQPRMIFRLPSGLKAFNWQFEIISRVPVHSVELASTMRELKGV